MRNAFVRKGQFLYKLLWFLGPLGGGHGRRCCCEDDLPNFRGILKMTEFLLLSLASSNKGDKMTIFVSRGERAPNDLYYINFGGNKLSEV